MFKRVAVLVLPVGLRNEITNPPWVRLSEPSRSVASLGFPQLVGDLLSMPASHNLAPTQRTSVILDRGA